MEKIEKLRKTITEYVKNHNFYELSEVIKSEKEIDLFFTDSKGRTLLHYAVAKVSQYGLPVLQLLLEHNLDPNSLDEKFESALDVARNNNNVPGLTIMKHFINKHNQELQTYL